MLQLIFGMNTVITLFVTLVFVYWLVLSFYGLKNPRIPARRSPKKRFLILVPAHDEEIVIGALIDNLLVLDYPKELFDVYVIADGCSDNTSGIARARGAKVLEHRYRPGELKGKPYAIAWALEHINLKRYDGVAFFDADNLVDHNFLTAMNDYLLAGYRLVQSYLDTKNPLDNWITLAYAAAFYYVNRAWQVAKMNLNLPVSIGGTGFCVDAKLLREIGWKALTLTEDLEFEMQCLLVGVRAAWCHETRIYDEKPLEFGASVIQRLRWGRGHWQVFFRYFGPLVRKFLCEGDVASLDGALHLLNPLLIVTAVYVGGVTCVQWALNLLGYTVILSSQVLPVYVGYLFLVYQLIYMSWCISKDTKLKSVAAIVPMLIFNITSMPLSIWALFTYNNSNWNRTAHVRSLQMQEVSYFGDFGD